MSLAARRYAPAVIQSAANGGVVWFWLDSDSLTLMTVDSAFGFGTKWLLNHTALPWL